MNGPPSAPADRPTPRIAVGVGAALVILAILGGFALSVDFPKAANRGFWSDEATYYMMGHSLAFDRDLTYRRADLYRVWREFPGGPSGVFLKRGMRVTGMGLRLTPPFIDIHGSPDPYTDRLFFGKSFIYPLVAAPLVRMFGTNGFLVLNAMLLAVAFFAAYVFVSARQSPGVALLLASGFVFASIVPAYLVWIMPEIFNFALGTVAYALWLYKYVATEPPARGWGWVRGPASVWVAGALIGIVTFSKVTNGLLLAPMAVWLLWRREWRQLFAACGMWFVFTAGLFGVNVAVTGDWNYQGGERVTCLAVAPRYPFEHDGWGLEVCGNTHARDDVLFDVMADKQVVWSNLRANLWYFFTGRNTGLIPYFFPAVFALVALLRWRRWAAPWQWFVLGGLVVHYLLFIFTQPYTWSGGGLGNRYFIGMYGACVFLLPPLRTRWTSVLPWILGGVFVSSVNVDPFHAAVLPADHTKGGVLRVFPTELTLINDLPIDAEANHVRVEFGGDVDPDKPNPKFQIYYLDDNGYYREADGVSFWVKGGTRAEVAIKAVRPYRQLQLTVSADHVATSSTISVGGQTRSVSLQPQESRVLTFDLDSGFPYKKDRPEPVYVWVLSASATNGFHPRELNGASQDPRYLGVKLLPVLIK